MSDSILEGSCLCGGVRYRAHGPLELFAFCHCVQCQKASGSEFAVNGTVDASSFELVEGEALLRDFESSPGEFRVFCGGCGSPLFKRFSEKPDKIRLRLGCLDTPVDQKPRLRVFMADGARFSRFEEDIPYFDGPPRAVQPSSDSP